MTGEGWANVISYFLPRNLSLPSLSMEESLFKASFQSALIYSLGSMSLIVALIISLFVLHHPVRGTGGAALFHSEGERGTRREPPNSAKDQHQSAPIKALCLPPQRALRKGVFDFLNQPQMKN